MNQRINSAIWTIDIILLASILIGWQATVFLLILLCVALAIKDSVGIIWSAVLLLLIVMMSNITLAFIAGVIITLMAKIAFPVLQLYRIVKTELSDPKWAWIYYAEEVALRKQSEVVVLQVRQ